ncbi:hypothetical protein FACS189418_7000 [Clostridia bacterium]|nr:hypothetical protein FACS189418_7000 [Clostridia bacterium]
MQNNHATDGIAEDLIRSITQAIALEGHEKTLLEKAIDEAENGLVDLQKEDIFEVHMDKIERYKRQLDEITQLRRKTMLALYALYEKKGNKNLWCSVKHALAMSYTLFEAWQASEDNIPLFDLYLESEKRKNELISEFLGVEITSCSACLADSLKGELSHVKYQ